MATQREMFIQKIAPYAQSAATRLNIPASVIIAQLAIESAEGTSNPAKNYNNYGGIMYTQYADFKAKISTQGTYFAGYNSIESFFRDYERVLNMSYYSAVRSAGTVEETVKALAASPYDAGHYGGSGNSILSYINSNNLRRFDGPGSVANSNTVAVNTSDIQIIKGVSNAVLLTGATALTVIALLKK